MNHTNTLHDLKNLRQDQSIILQVDQNISSELEELAHRKCSIEELFKSCLEDAEAPMDKVNEVIKQYTIINVLLEKVMCNLLLTTLGEKAFIYLRDPMTEVNYYFNFTLNAIIISKQLT